MRDSYYYSSMAGTLLVCSGIIGILAAVALLSDGLILVAGPAGFLLVQFIAGRVPARKKKTGI